MLGKALWVFWALGRTLGRYSMVGVQLLLLHFPKCVIARRVGLQWGAIWGRYMIVAPGGVCSAGR